MKITIVYDDIAYNDNLTPGWGFSSVIELADRIIMFDTGGNGTVLLSNMEDLGINPRNIDVVFLSHIHSGHCDGLGSLLFINSNIKVYLPQSFPEKYKKGILDFGAEVEEIYQPGKIFDGVFTTGEIAGVVPEQSLALVSKKGLVVLTGCAHYGIVNIVQKLKGVTGDDAHLVLGGFHSQGKSVGHDFKKMGVEKAAPCHCTGDEALTVLRNTYNDNFIEIGVGKEIVID